MRVESRLSWLAAAAGPALCAAVAVVGADARWLAALGAAITHAGHIPASVPYAAAPSHDWVNVPALGELVFHWLWGLGGERGLVLAQTVAVALTFALLVRDMRASRAPDSASALVLVMLPFAAVASLFIVRAQMFSLPMFALTLLLLRRESRAQSRRIWLLVPLVVLWSNLHGGCSSASERQRCTSSSSVSAQSAGRPSRCCSRRLPRCSQLRGCCAPPSTTRVFSTVSRPRAGSG